MSNLIHYLTRPSEEQIEILRAFSESGERSDPITFAGRDDILQRIQRLIQYKRDDPSLNSITQVIQGAPGAGKTSLLNEMARQSHGDHVSIVRFAGEDLTESVRVAERFMRSIGEDAAEIGAAGTRTRRTTGDIKIAQHQEGWETRMASVLERITQGAAVWDALEPMLKVDEDHVFLFLVDEAQLINKTKGKEVNEIVTSLHLGGYSTAGLRILPVFAGLSSTSDRLRDVGLSRQATAPHQLSVLTLEEAQLAADGFLCDESMGLRDTFSSRDRSEMARTFAIASEGWPRHLHHYLTGLANELVKDYKRQDSNGAVRMDTALELGHEKRCDYYDERLQAAELGSVEKALMALTRRGQQDITLESDDIMEYIEENYSDQSISVPEIIAKAVHAGVIERRGDLGRDIYSYPIPSFSTYMSNYGDREKTLTNMRSTVKERLISAN